MADRIVVLFEGRVMRDFARADADEDAIMRAARAGRRGRVTSVAEEQGVIEPRSELARPRRVPRPLRSSESCWRSIVVGATTLDNHLFLSAANVQQILAGSAIIALLAIGETIVIITRNVDLSIGSILGISATRPACSTSTTWARRAPRRLSRGARDRSRLRCGERPDRDGRRVPSLVVTLGTLYIIRGIDGAWAGGNQVNASMLPDSFNKIGYATVLGSRTSAGSGSSPSRSPPTRCAASERPATSMPSARSRCGAPRRHPGRIARLPRLRAERRHRRRHRGAVAVLVRVGRCDRGRRVRVPGDRRRRRRRCGDLRRERAPSSARRSARSSSTRSTAHWSS